MTPVTRRTFLKTSAAATIAATAQANTAPNEIINVAVIGCRNRGRQVAGYFQQAGDFRITHLCDCDSAMSGDALGKLEESLSNRPETVSDFRRVLDNRDVDAVVIATPDHWHGLMTTMALDAGKHVYLEKPASYNIGDGKAMLAAHARHPELTVHIGTQQRSGDHFRDAKAFIDAGGLGDVAFARAWITHTRDAIAPVPDTAPPDTLDYEMWVGPAPMHPYNENRTHYNWHWVRDWGTGEMGNWGAHWLDVARWFLDLGVPRSVSAHGGCFVGDDIKEWPDTQTVLYEYPELTLLWEQRLWTEYTANRMRSGVECAGDKGTLLIDRSGWTVHPRDGKIERHGKSELVVSHARNFADAVRGVAHSNAPLIEGHRSAILCHLGNIATLVNRRLEFDAENETILNDAEAAAFEYRATREPWPNPA